MKRIEKFLSHAKQIESTLHEQRMIYYKPVDRNDIESRINYLYPTLKY